MIPINVAEEIFRHQGLGMVLFKGRCPVCGNQIRINAGRTIQAILADGGVYPCKKCDTPLKVRRGRRFLAG